MKGLIISADNFEDTELIYPYYRLKEEGINVDIASIEKGIIKGKHGYEVDIDEKVDDIDPERYHFLILPGGKAPSALRENERVLDITRKLFEKGKIIAAICHGPQVLISAGLLRDRKVTSYKSVRDEVLNAGAEYLDKAVVVDDNIITSRVPDDIPFFMRELLKKIK